jgi:hypothetical protein
MILQQQYILQQNGNKEKKHQLQVNQDVTKRTVKSEMLNADYLDSKATSLIEN